MSSTSEFGDHTAVFAVEIYLRGDDIGQDGAAILDNGAGCLITCTFYS